MSCMSAMSIGPFPLALLRSYPAAFHTAFATWRPGPAVCYLRSENVPRLNSLVITPAEDSRRDRLLNCEALIG
jgi:hypothetical protein